MDNLNGHVVNLANSIIGVSILAMPYCFKQCGILLSVCILLISSIISRLACHFLLKSAIIARRKTFEFLAFHIFGSLGKFCIEIGMIGFLLGTCIAFFVVMGDLGPEIVSEMTGVKTGNALRNGILVALAIFCVLPLGLLRNVDSLNGVSKATIGFYCCLVLKIIIEALPHIFTGDWVSEVVLWRPAGILQCLPIFSMALFCQTQIFEIYQALPNASLEKMNGVIRIAVNICTWVYIFVGAFGYIAFFQKPFTGNILLSFKPSAMSDVMKMGFVLSLAFSSPLVIFPCRASLYSLLYKGPSYTVIHEGGASNYIPEGKFKLLTLIIVSVSLAIGILIPNIELVLGLVGSTIGVMICVLFPVTCFICISPKNTNERILAQIMLFVGIIVMVLGTYANLYAFEEAKMHVVTEKIIPKEDIKPKDSIKDLVNEILLKPNIGHEKVNVMDIPTTIKINFDEKSAKKEEAKLPNPASADEKNPKEVRHEPPQPEEPPADNSVQEKAKILEAAVAKTTKVQEMKEVKAPPVLDSNDKQGPVVEPVQPLEEKPANKEEQSVNENKVQAPDPKQDIPAGADVNIGENKRDVPENKDKEENIVPKNAKKNDEVDAEAIKKEETELKEQEKEKPVEDKNQMLIETIQKQNEVQKEIVEQQKKLIEVIIQKQQENAKNPDVDKVNEEKVKAVKQIESIARKAIETISGQDNKKAAAVKDIEMREEVANDKSKVAGADVKNDELNQTVVNQDKKNESKINLVPLPIALAKMNNVTIDAKKEEFKKTENNEGDAKSMRRDILSEDEAKIRAKREVEDDTNKEQTKEEKLNKAVKEVCEEMNKLTSTEKPVIKMLCKLSEPDLVAIDTGTLEKKNSIDVKPQKRDLKSLQ